MDHHNRKKAFYKTGTIWDIELGPILLFIYHTIKHPHAFAFRVGYSLFLLFLFSNYAMPRPQSETLAS